MEELVNYCKKYHKDKTEAVIKYADMFCRHEFLFNTENDLEQIDDVMTYGRKIDWEWKPADDQEYVWQFNRHRCFITMGQAYQITLDEKYAIAYADMLEDWILSCPFTESSKTTTWRILEAGFRGDYWTHAFELFKDSPNVTDELKKLMYDCLRVHAKYIISMHNAYRLISNWGVIENHGLFLISLTLPEDDESREYRNIAIDHLDKLCRMSIMPDGAEWEQSPMYHNEVLKDLLDVVIIAKRKGFDLPQSILDTVYNMAMADLKWMKPDHHEFMMGDSDDFDMSQYLCKAAIAFEDPVLKSGAKEIVDFETVWEVGIEGIRVFESMKKTNPSFTSVAMEDTGNYFFRSSWEEDANVLRFHCGTIGAGHGHSDQLHFDIIAKGEDVLMDSGRYTYVWGDKRNEYKNPTAHNTIIVDGKYFTVNKDSWECSKLSAPVKQQYRFLDKYEFVQGGHLGYMMDLGVFINRKSIHIKGISTYIIVDECYANSAHKYQGYLHFNEHGTVELCDNRAIYRGIKADTVLDFITPNTTTTIIDTHISRSYNHETVNKTIVYEWQGESTCTNIIVVHTIEHGRLDDYKIEKIPIESALKGCTYEDYMAEGIKISTDKTAYVATICHQEINSPTDLVKADGCLGFGAVIVFDKNKSTEVGNVLCY